MVAEAQLFSMDRDGEERITRTIRNAHDRRTRKVVRMSVQDE